MGGYMSDRVAYIGGNTPGVDHTPLEWHTIDSNPDRYQVALPIHELCYAYWRVKSWRVYGGVSYHIDPSFDQSYEWDYIATIGDNDDTGANVATRESDLVVPRAIFASDNPGSEDGGLVSLEMFSLNFLDSGVLKPLVEFTLYSGAVSIYMTTRKDATYNVDSGITASINTPSAFFLTMYKSASAIGEVSGTFTVAINEFWPYKLRDGSPVWDTSNGAQLEDPLADYDIDDIEEEITGAPDAVTPSTLLIHRNPSPWIAI
jgi:hypothetical protein